MTVTSSDHLALLLARQREAQRQHPVPGEAERRADLLQLRACLLDHREAICDAISADYGYRSPHETRLTEIFPVLQDIEHALTHLRRWMRPRRAEINRLAFGLASNRVLPQPLGVIGVIVPWNFPLNLSLSPLVSILAAGNHAMLKMSEHSRHFARLLVEITRDRFPPEKLLVLEDPGDLGPVFSSLPFDHLLFTGSSATGRKVAAAAAANLCPVTLELGGRSPALVCDDFDPGRAAERIIQAKCLNAGQICVTVDHVYLPRAQVDRFVEAATVAVRKRYGTLASPDYSSLIHDAAYQRLTGLLTDAVERGARVLPLMPAPHHDAATHRLAPHLVIDPPDEAAVMRGEIFGPVLPILPYDHLDDVIARIQRQPRPLAFYPFTRQRERVRHLLEGVMSGGVTVNDAIFHVGQSGLPFGGVGESGMGHYHGRAGFENFSKLRPVFYQSRWAVTRLVQPPYGKAVEAVLQWFRS
jgi:coniferyl-aldehyde dehydrogenase